MPSLTASLLEPLLSRWHEREQCHDERKVKILLRFNSINKLTIYYHFICAHFTVTNTVPPRASVISSALVEDTLVRKPYFYLLL